MLSEKDLELSCKVSELRDAMTEYLEEGVKNWLRKEQNLEMWDMYCTDVHDLGVVLMKMEEGNLDRAWYEASQLETAARDVIPGRVYDYLYENGSDKGKWRL
tara:strand:- start:504 stop:809 length:306 start_codon:yes stop_codon:yes gene_type:complete